jgi:NADH-quinone oxidoreductase subunit H
MSALTLISDNIFDIFIILMWSMVVFVPILVGVILAVYGDRKIWAAVQKRKGPNVVGPFGLFQVPADGLKYIFKEIIIPDGADKILFIFAPILTFSLAIAAWSVIQYKLVQYFPILMLVFYIFLQLVHLVYMEF